MVERFVGGLERNSMHAASFDGARLHLSTTVANTTSQYGIIHVPVRQRKSIMSSSCVVPITNVYAKGDFTASVAAGSHGQQLNLVLDSGSSTLVVKAQSFDAASDQMLKGTTSAQSVAYGIGSWAGPVITTQVQMGHSDSQVTLPDVHLALAEEVASGSFAESDGFLGTGLP